MKKENMEKIMALYHFRPNTYKTYKEATSLILYCFGIQGSTDPDNICSVIGTENTHAETICKESAEKIADRLIGTNCSKGAYESLIPKKARSAVIGMLISNGRFTEYQAKVAIQTARESIRQKLFYKKQDPVYTEHETARRELLAIRQKKLTAFMLKDRKARKKFEKMTFVQVSLRIKKEDARNYDEYTRTECLKEHPIYGKTLAKKEASDGAVITLKASSDDGSHAALQATVEQNGVEPVSRFVSMPKNYMHFKMAVADKWYYIHLERLAKEDEKRQAEKIKRIKQQRELAYPANLFSDVIEKSVTDITDKQTEALKTALHTLPEADRQTLYLYYHDRKTLKQIGESAGVCAERIRQRISLSLATLCHYGYLDNPSAKDSTAKETKLESMWIADCDFSVRLGNCLQRAGIHTVEDLLTYSWKDLMSRRGFGSCCAEELQKFLSAHGLKLTDKKI